MDDICAAIAACPEEDMRSLTVQCRVEDHDGLKLITNPDFADALFPDIQNLLSELLVEGITTTEETP